MVTNRLLEHSDEAISSSKVRNFNPRVDKERAEISSSIVGSAAAYDAMKNLENYERINSKSHYKSNL